MQFKVSSSSPHSRYIDIELTIENINTDFVDLHLPGWRPGRYELGNFSKNIQRWVATDDKGNVLPSHKTDKNTWHVTTKDLHTIIIRYNYYAAQQDAGACWVDENVLYINPVHFCFYIEDRMHLPCSLQLSVPQGWKVATGLTDKGNNLYYAADFHQLVDCPLIASPALMYNSYSVNDIKFNIWFYGECRPQWEKIIKDFKGFTENQLEMMNKFPVDEYHFLILVLPYKFYHGVEHGNSTVLALGPGYKLMEDELYTDLIGVASHELFHAWNIKTIRPSSMLPYHYAIENYSRLGWVYEGFTTYYGDLFLARSGFFKLNGYLAEVNTRLQRHMDNYGRFNHSVGDSSFDTWLDGYVPGIPHRKTSIYDEGSLIALMADLFIRKYSGWKYSLDDVMRSLYNDFALQHRGYRENDIKSLIENFSGANASALFDQYINGSSSYDEYLQELLNEVGCYIMQKPTKNHASKLFGIKTTDGPVLKVLSCAPGSPADVAGLSKDDELVCVNGLRIENNFAELLKYFEGNEITLEVFTQSRKRTLLMKPDGKEYYPVYSLGLFDDAGKKEKDNFTKWCGIAHSV